MDEGGRAAALEVALEPAMIAIEPGDGASCEVRVRNHTDVAVELTLEIFGEVAAWAWAAPHQLVVAGGGDVVARVVFRPPRSTHVSPGSTPFTLKLVPTGESAAAESVSVDGLVDIAGFASVTARLIPTIVEARRQASHELVLENEGTRPARVHVEATSGPGGPDVAVNPETADVAPLSSQRASVTVRAPGALLVRRPRRHQFQLVITTEAGAGDLSSPLLVDGVLRQRPLRAVVPIVVVALLVAMGGGLSALTGREANEVGQANGDGSPVAAPTAPPELPVPRYAVGTRTQTFVDPDRPTRAYVSFPALPDRTLETLVFYPAAGPAGGEATEAAAPATAGGPFPLIIFAHGSGGLGDRYFGMLQTWAAAGYVVAAPVFPFARVPDQASPDDYPNQPGDMSLVADELLARNADESHELAGLIDPERLGAAGHSLGGMTTLGLVANTCCHDERFDAGVVLAGREVPFPGGDFWLRIRTPVLLIHGDADASVVYADGRAAFLAAPPPKHLVTLEEADHSEPYQATTNLPAVRVVLATTLAFFDYHLRGDEDGLDRMQAAGDIEGTSRIDSET